MKVRRVVAWSVVNVVGTVVLQAAIEFLVTDVLNMKSLLLIKGSKWGLNHLPNPWAMVKHALVGVLSRNVSLSNIIRGWAKVLTWCRCFSTTSIPTCCTRQVVADWQTGMQVGTTAFRFRTRLPPITITRLAIFCIGGCRCISLLLRFGCTS